MEDKNKIEFKGKYISVVGKRKNATAQIRLYKDGKGIILINNMKAKEYFPTEALQQIITKPLKLSGLEKVLNFSILTSGGGKKGQADAVRHGISRALIVLDKNLRPTLKAEQLLTRDPRKKERKKPGLKKARRAPQWSKR